MKISHSKITASSASLNSSQAAVPTLYDEDDFDRRWNEKFGEPTTEVFLADEFDQWWKDVMEFE